MQLPYAQRHVQHDSHVHPQSACAKQQALDHAAIAIVLMFAAVATVSIISLLLGTGCEGCTTKLAITVVAAAAVTTTGAPGGGVIAVSTTRF
jgi:uncharacterized membrane protein YeiB